MRNFEFLEFLNLGIELDSPNCFNKTNKYTVYYQKTLRVYLIHINEKSRDILLQLGKDIDFENKELSD